MEYCRLENQLSIGDDYRNPSIDYLRSLLDEVRETGAPSREQVCDHLGARAVVEYGNLIEEYGNREGYGRSVSSVHRVYGRHCAQCKVCAVCGVR